MRYIKHLQKIAGLMLVTDMAFASDVVYESYKRLLGDMDNQQAIITFIDDDNYLSDRLRKKWLTHLYKQGNYALYITHYKPSKSTVRKCQYLTALYHTGQEDKALKQVEPLWFKGHSQPKECNALFGLWQDSKYFNNDLIWQRFQLAVDSKEYGLAKSLKPLMRDEDKKLADKWILISRAPHRIKTIHLTPHDKNTAMLTHGIRKLVKGNINNAIKNWRHMEKSHDFSHEEKQHILRTIALYAAMRNRSDSIEWFNKLDPKLMPKMHHEWRVRAALKQRDWENVLKATQQLPKELQEKPCWQYWQARALEKTGQEKKALTIYQTLSKKRHYYGFLASFRANIKPSMQHDDYRRDRELIKKYQPQIDYINALYESNKHHQASLLSYELTNSLSDKELVQLARIYASWKWHEKALHVANLSKHKNNLNLRFPLAHKELVMKHATKYDIEPSLVYAVIRQESTFRKNAKSSANAMGLMQVIPSTARRVAKKNAIKLSHLKQMY